MLSLVYRIEHRADTSGVRDYCMQGPHFNGRTDMRSRRTHRIQRGAMSLPGESLKARYSLPSPQCEGLDFRSGVDVCGVHVPELLEEWFPGQRKVAFKHGYVLRVYLGHARRAYYQCIMHTDMPWRLVHEGAWHAFTTPHNVMERVFLS